MAPAASLAFSIFGNGRRGLSLIRRAICRWHANCLPGFTLDDVRWCGMKLIRGAIYRWHAGCRIIPSGSRVRFLQRLLRRFVRLERGPYPLIVVRPLDIAQVRRVPPHMPTRLGRALVEPNKSAATKRAATKPTAKPQVMVPSNPEHSCAEPVLVRPSVCTGVRISDSITATAGITAHAARAAATACAAAHAARAACMRNHWWRYRGHQQRSHQGNFNDQSEHFCLPAL